MKLSEDFSNPTVKEIQGGLMGLHYFSALRVWPPKTVERKDVKLSRVVSNPNPLAQGVKVWQREKQNWKDTKLHLAECNIQYIENL